MSMPVRFHVRVDLFRSGDIGAGADGVARLEFREAAQIQRVGVIWAEPQRRAVVGDGAVVFALVAPRHGAIDAEGGNTRGEDRKSTRLNSSHQIISYAVFCLKKKKSLSQLVSC